jgi:hypothetical protein
LRSALNQGLKGIVKFTHWVDKILSENHWLEKKKKSLGLEKIFYLLYCKSNVYAYI